MSTKDRIEWIENTLLSRMLVSYPDWKGCKVTGSRVRALETNTDNWASTLYFLDVTLTRDEVTVTQDVVVKVMPDDLETRTMFQSEKQFANEIHFYTEILPFFASIQSHRDLPNPDVRCSTSRYPMLLYSCLNRNDTELDRKPPPFAMDDGIVVLENLKSDSYELGPRESLDYDHCRMAMDELGKLHGLAYVGKLLFPKQFHETVVGKVQETTFIPKPPEDGVVDFYKMSIRRILDVLEVENDQDYSDFIKRLSYTEDSMEFMLDLVRPREPLAVLCHGDFCRNNMMFRYVEGHPMQVKLLDFQTIRYASPAIDLSFFLFMNTTSQLRSDHMQDLFLCYHDSVMRIMAEYLEEIPPGFGLEDFMEDFRKHAMHGYLVTMFFLPWMLSDKEEMAEVDRIGDACGRTSLQYLEASVKVGGEPLTSILLEMTKELIQAGYI